MAEQKNFYRIVEKKDKALVVDLDNHPLQPSEALRLAHALEKTAEGKSYVYFGFRESDGLFKIGRTEDLKRRQSELGIQFVHTIECALYGDESSPAVESALHKFFSDDNVEGEWFRLLKSDVGMAKRDLQTPRDVYSFINAYHSILEDSHSKSLAMLVAEFIEDEIHEMVTRKALWYIVQHAAEYKELHKMEDAGYAMALLDVLLEISQIRTKSAVRQTKTVRPVLNPPKLPIEIKKVE